MEIYKKGKDKGYLGHGINWWFNPNFSHSFSIFNLDSFYQNNYFKKDHVFDTTAKKYVDYVLGYGEVLMKKKLHTILEVGSGGGWFTKEFIDRKVNIFAIEGSMVGYEKTRDRVGEKHINQVLKHDLRLPLDLDKKFDIAICTEVAEHIEPPFSSQLIQTLTKHSKIIWFSFEKPLTNEQHYHHSNEQPEKFWQNLFQFYDFNMIKLPQKLIDDIEGRGGYIFYHKSLKIPQIMRQYIVKKNNSYGNFEKINDKSPIQTEIYSSKRNKHFFIYMAHILLKMSDKIERLADKILCSI